MATLSEKLYNFLRKKNPDMYERVLQDLGPGGHSMRDLNNYFRLELAHVPECTINERECLVSDLPDDAWIDYFESTVYPTLYKYDLPKR